MATGTSTRKAAKKESFTRGDPVLITDGPFANFAGIVQSVDEAAVSYTHLTLPTIYSV